MDRQQYHERVTAEILDALKYHSRGDDETALKKLSDARKSFTKMLDGKMDGFTLFCLGFAVSREGFNGEAAYEHAAPLSEPIMPDVSLVDLTDIPILRELFEKVMEQL